eukprot:1720857-Prymnesium_polylepis.1
MKRSGSSKQKYLLDPLSPNSHRARLLEVQSLPLRKFAKFAKFIDTTGTQKGRCPIGTGRHVSPDPS